MSQETRKLISWIRWFVLVALVLVVARAVLRIANERKNVDDTYKQMQEQNAKPIP